MSRKLSITKDALPNADIGKRIKALRKSFDSENKKMTLDIFAESLGIAQSSLSQIENGVSPPSGTLLKLICIQFLVNEEWLLKGTGPMFKEARPAGYDLDHPENTANKAHKYLANIYESNDKQIIWAILANLATFDRTIDQTKRIEDLEERIKNLESQNKASPHPTEQAG